MKKTLVTISGAVILQALRKANPVTAAGRAAVENYKGFLVKNVMTAIALENSLISLDRQICDAGLEGLVGTLKGIMPEQKRRVAVAYELLAQKPSGTFLEGTPACMAALEGLYDMDAMNIIDAINGGALSAYATVPEVAQLIAWARAAVKAEPERRFETGDIKVSMVPVLNLAVAGDNMLISMDGANFLRANSGKLTYVPSIADISGIPEDVRVLVSILNMMHADPATPNVIRFNEGMMEQINKALPVKNFGIDLLGSANDLVIINDNAMSVEKAKAILGARKSDILAAVLLSSSAKDAMRVMVTAMDLFERYRGSISNNSFAYKFEGPKGAMYVVENAGTCATAMILNKSVVGTKLYNSVFDLLGSEDVVVNSELHAAISKVFATQLKAEAKRMSIRKQILEQITEERQKYQALLDRIDTELSNLEADPDANEDKVAALKELKTKTEAQLAKIAEEIDKLGK